MSRNQRPITFDVLSNGCHVCTSHAPNKKGYINYQQGGKWYRLHRFLYEEAYGKLPENVVVRHKCDTPACINLEHLTPGTVQDNNIDRVVRERSRGGQLGGWKTRVPQDGERNGNAKLTSTQVEQIRASTENNVQLGKRFGVTHQAIWQIRKGLTWTEKK